MQRPVIARGHAPALIRQALAGYRELFRKLGVPSDQLRPYGEQSAEQIRLWAPALHTELVALAREAELETWELGLLNARTEVLATVGATAECSTAVYIGGPGAPHTLQTWDWHEEFGPTKVLVERPGVRLFTEAGILGKIGVNSAGLGLHFNILGHAADGAEIGVPVHVVARRVLDEARTVAEAVDVARSARVSASTVLTVVTYAGRVADADAVGIELSAGGTAVLRPDADGFLLHTNHFLDPVLAKGERSTADATTYARLEHLRARKELLREENPARWTELLRMHEPPVCCHPQPGLPSEQQWQTLVTVGLDLAARRLRVHDGGPCTAGEAAAWERF